MAITWKNISFAENSNAAKFTELGQQDVANAMRLANEGLTNAQTQNQNVINRAREDNVNSVMGSLYDINSPQQFEEMQKSGAIKSIMASVTDPRDRAALMQVPEARFQALLQKRDMDIARAHNEQVRADRPGMLEINRMLLDNTDPTVIKQNASLLSPEGEVAALTALKNTQTTNFQNAINKQRLIDGEELRKREHPIRMGALELQGQQYTDTVTQNDITAKMNTAAIAYKQAENEKLKKLGVIADKGFFPVTASGLPDIPKMRTNPDVYANWQNIVAKSGLAPGNDTQMADTAIDTLHKAGIPAKHAAFLDTFRPLFNTQPTDLVGKEQAALAKGTAAIDEKNARVNSTNSMFLTNENIIDRLKPFNESLKLKGLDEDKIAAINDVITEELTNSEGEPVNLSALLQATSLAKEWGDSLFGRAKTSDWWSSYKTDVKDRYNEVKNTPANIEQRSQFILHRGDNDKARKELLRESLRK